MRSGMRQSLEAAVILGLVSGAQAADEMGAVEGLIPLAAAKGDRRSWELPQLGHRILTQALTDGLKGEGISEYPAITRDGGCSA